MGVVRRLTVPGRRHSMRTAGLAPLALLMAVLPVRAQVPAGVEALLEVRPAAAPGFEPDALPVRFALFDDGRIVVGGTRVLYAGKLEKAEHKALEKRLGQLERTPGLGAPLVFGPGSTRYRLALPDKRLEVNATGDPQQAPPELRVVAQLVDALEHFDHASLRPLPATQVWARAREQRLPGGCRPWRGPLPLAELATAARALPADAFVDWPTGALAASACENGRAYVVTLRPLLPGERP